MRKEKNNGNPSSLVKLAYRVKEAAQLCGVSEKSMRRAIDRGLLKVNRTWRIIIIPAAELEKFIKA